MHKASFVVFALMDTLDASPLTNQALAVPVAGASAETGKHPLWFPALGGFVTHLCRTYRHNEQNVGSIYTLMELVGVDTNRETSYTQRYNRFKQQLSAPQWVNLLTAVENTLVSSDFIHPMQLWFTLRDKALDLCLPGAFGYWSSANPTLPVNDDIADTGGLDWLFSAMPVQPSQPVQRWVPAVYKYGTLDAGLFEGVSCLTHIPWMDLMDVHGVNPVPDTDIERLIFYGLYPDGGCVAQTYKWGTASIATRFDPVLYTVLSPKHLAYGMWHLDKAQHFEFDKLITM